MSPPWPTETIAVEPAGAPGTSMFAALRRDRRTLLALARPVNARAPLRDRLEAFYAPQAEDYDAFRDRMLHGRRELVDDLPVPPGGVWVELGAGTGRNVAYLGRRRADLDRVYLVDLAPSLLAVARARVARCGWTNVTCLEADAARTGLPSGIADTVVCSYALTMMPAWREALVEAERLLKPGGHIGVVDFHRPARPGGLPWPHDVASRRFLPWWFGRRHVRLSIDHLPCLADQFRFVRLVEAFGSIPYLPGVRAPYYRFIGACRSPCRSAMGTLDRG